MNSSLSESGMRRRDDILKLAIEESRRLHKRRRRVRLAAALSILVVGTSAYIHWPPRPQLQQAREPQVSEVFSEFESYIVKNEVSDLTPYLLETREELTADMLLDDDELLSALADFGRREGIIRTRDRVWLASELELAGNRWQ